MQIAVEIRVEPKPRTYRPVVSCGRLGTAPQRNTHRVRPFSTVVSRSGFPVNRHHVSSSGPTLASLPTTATRSPGRCGAAQRSTPAADQTQRSFARYPDRRRPSSECLILQLSVMELQQSRGPVSAGARPTRERALSDPTTQSRQYRGLAILPRSPD